MTIFIYPLFHFFPFNTDILDAVVRAAAARAQVTALPTILSPRVSTVEGVCAEAVSRPHSTTKDMIGTERVSNWIIN